MKDKNEVNDTVERVGEIILSFAGTGYAIFGNLDDLYSFLLIVICFGLYQSTSMLKYFQVWVGKDKD